ncbi:MAG: ATP-grasp ribosomal peptide maturase [Actinophytocola sp.]|uniref:ATP-grasp ribosomal peptide maturase n=1 Tax=Actinophytocola sp. TaxID=1872138 RepID=UPI0013264124|nr:ATP-grasp ribosomal peptide maturase [Actinophytocola sp.]MPZ85241.1 ATP-grasp ribosomal peptide maturase [Actinophytocola sp.]
MPATVLVVTEQFDVTADHVVTELTERGTPVVRFDTAEFPRRLVATARLDQDRCGTLRIRGLVADLRDVGAVYYRRPSIYQPHPGLSQADAAWAVREARFGFGGLLSSLPVWLNHPANIARAEYKPVQFAAARAAGLTVPPTLLTNDAHEARLFAKEVGPIVYKPLSGIAYTHEHGRDFIYTQPVQLDQLDDAAIGATMCLFQQAVPKAFEVRVTVVDGRCFAARIDAHSDRARVDWRADYDALTYEPIKVPGDVRAKTAALMRALRLRFGALDFIVTPSGEWTWLEINPNGQWAWIDALTPRIASAIADALDGRTAP